MDQSIYDIKTFTARYTIIQLGLELISSRLVNFGTLGRTGLPDS